MFRKTICQRVVKKMEEAERKAGGDLTGVRVSSGWAASVVAAVWLQLRGGSPTGKTCAALHYFLLESSKQK